MQITAEIMQTYDLLNLPEHDLRVLWLVFSLQHNTKCPYKQEWSDKKAERPKNKQQMYKCHEL